MNIWVKNLIVVILGVTAGLMHRKAFNMYYEQVIRGISHPPKATWLLWIFLSTLNWLSFFVSTEKDWFLVILPAISTIYLFKIFYSFVRKNKLSRLNFWDNIALIVSIIAVIVWAWYGFNRIGAIYSNCILQFSIFISFCPYFERYLKGCEEEKGPLPWFIFSGAYFLQLAAVLIKWKGYHLLPYPINCFFLHLFVGLLGLLSLKKS